MGTSLLTLEQKTRLAYRAAREDLLRRGIEVITTSTRRTIAEQRVLFRAFVTGKSKFPVARPGTSTHELGIAIDLVPKNRRDMPTVISAMAIAGFKWADVKDCVHFTFLPSSRLVVGTFDSSSC